MSETTGYQSPTSKDVAKRCLKSNTDPECGYIDQKNKDGLGYLTEMTSDTNYGIITGVDCYPANYREHDIILNHIRFQKETLPFVPKTTALDRGYNGCAVHSGMECKNIKLILVVHELMPVKTILRLP